MFYCNRGQRGGETVEPTWTIDYRFVAEDSTDQILPLIKELYTQVTGNDSVYSWNLENNPDTYYDMHEYSYAKTGGNPDYCYSSGHIVFTGIPIEDEINLSFGQMASAPDGYNLLDRDPAILLYKDGTVEEYIDPSDPKAFSILNIIKVDEYSVIVEVIFSAGVRI